MKNKKSLALLLMAVTLTGALGACNSSTPTTKPNTPAAMNSTSTSSDNSSTATITSTQSTGNSGTTTGTTIGRAAITPATAAGGTEQPVAPETNPVGDIPDTQAFVKYTSGQGGYELDVPEGWARSESGMDVSFADKLDGVKVIITDTTSTPTLSSVQAAWIPALQKSVRAVQVGGVKEVALPGGKAMLVDYTSNSEPNVVTGKQSRLENNAYLFYNNGKLAVLTLWAPVGADNVDQWRRMSQSFKWR